MPIPLQIKLLRVLQERTLERLGSNQSIAVDCRLIAATKADLDALSRQNQFRSDLYYRLNVVTLELPPLRERREDLMALADHFFHLYASEKSSRLQGFSQRAIAAILDHAWPGNVRELINRVRRALVMSDARLITPDDLGLGSAAASAHVAALDDVRERSERSTLRDCLDRSGQNVSLAARELGISRTTMYRLLNKHSMRA